MDSDWPDQAAGYESGHGQHIALTYRSNYNKQRGLQAACTYLQYICSAACACRKANETWSLRETFEISDILSEMRFGPFVDYFWNFFLFFFVQRLMEVYDHMSHPGCWFSDLGLGVQTGWWTWRRARGSPGQRLDDQARPQVQCGGLPTLQESKQLLSPGWTSQRKFSVLMDSWSGSHRKRKNIGFHFFIKQNFGKLLVFPRL